MPRFGYGDIRKIEECGCSITNFDSLDKHIFGVLNAFVAITCNVNAAEADSLLEQHIMGGGDTADLFQDFMKALYESPFVKKLMEKGQEAENAPKTARKTKAQQ